MPRASGARGADENALPPHRRRRRGHAEVGPLALRVDDVARRAGCSRATLYRYVADKDELIREVLVGRSALADELEADLDEAGDPADWIAEGLLRHAEAGEEAVVVHGAGAGGRDRRHRPPRRRPLGGGGVARRWSAVPRAHRGTGRPAPDITVDQATEWLIVVHLSLLGPVFADRPRTHRAEMLRTFVAYAFDCSFY